MARTDDPGARELGLKDAELLSISKDGELAIRLNTEHLRWLCAKRDAGAGSVEWGNATRSAGECAGRGLGRGRRQAWRLSVIVPENNHWRLEYPIGKVLFDSINWISHPKISPDGKWVAFADHENPGGDDEGSVAVIAADGKDKTRKETFFRLDFVAGDSLVASRRRDLVYVQHHGQRARIRMR